MKSSSFLLSLLLCFSLQARNIESILAQPELPLNIYRLKTSVNRALVLPMSYGQYEIISESDRKIISSSQVYSIDLVYTDFPKGQDLTALNKMRLQVLYKLRKELISDDNIKWRIIKQTSCANEEEARVLFHGIVIHYRPEQGEAVRKLDLENISNLPETGAEITKKVSRVLPYGIRLADTSVMRILNRNKSWKDMTIVADMTGSMSPYAVQLLVWLQLKIKENRTKQVVFFNDGDSKMTNDKIIGKTGGIYISPSITYEDVLKTARLTISKGSGGDAPENNCEALLVAQEKFPESKELILVADNLAPLKDLVLASQIKIPVRIIICGSEFKPISREYLELARMTGGSIHTIFQDIENLAKMNEGETIKVGAYIYQVSAGKFVLLKKA